MKNFNDFHDNIIVPRQLELADKIGKTISGKLHETNLKDLPMEVKTGITASIAMASTASFELTIELLREYHKWVSQEK